MSDDLQMKSVVDAAPPQCFVLDEGGDSPMREELAVREAKQSRNRNVIASLMNVDELKKVETKPAVGRDLTIDLTSSPTPTQRLCFCWVSVSNSSTFSASAQSVALLGRERDTPCDRQQQGRAE